jgi:hypothetical protein
MKAELQNAGPKDRTSPSGWTYLVENSIWALESSRRVDAYQTKCNDFRVFTKLGNVSGK